MNAVPLVIVIPLLSAAVLSVLGPKLSRWAVDALSGAVALTCFALCLHLAEASIGHPYLYWFGGWKSLGGLAPGICFYIDPIAAGLAAFTSLLMLSAFVFSARYFREVKSHFHVLMLIFLGAMCAFSLTGDLFNLFVWFELMTGAGIALCGYKIEELGPLQGAMNFAVSNTIGAFLGLTGIILLYGRTGALNMAQAAHALSGGGGADSIVIVSFIFIACGFLVKTAAVPFHFWLADAHAVAPTPVCMLFSGVMVELGLYAVGRVYGSVYSEVLSVKAPLVHEVFLWMGVLTALLGGVMCFLQRHLKRLLAFSTISHVGLMVIGFSFLSAESFAGTAIYVVGHGLIKAALFASMGVLLNRFACVDEYKLRGKGKAYLGLGVLFLALGLADLPPFVLAKGAALIESAAERSGQAWVSWIFIVACALTAGAVLRVWGRVFRGWGNYEKISSDEARGFSEMPETQGSGSLVLMYIPVIALLVLSLVLNWMPGWIDAVLKSAPELLNSSGYQARVLGGASVALSPAVLPPLGSATMHSLISIALACGLAVFGLQHHSGSKRPIASLFSRIAHGLHALHSGEIGDYIAWFAVGVATYAGVLLWVR